MNKTRHIIIRLPNWLGDMVMSTAFVRAVRQQYPDASIDLICKKGLDFLLDYFPTHNHAFIFDKTEYKGLRGAWKFGRNIGRQKKYELFFCLPDSFSSAVMAKATGSQQSIGFKKEGRSVLLSHPFKKPAGLHRVDEYLNLLEQYSKEAVSSPMVELLHKAGKRTSRLVININSEAASRRLPLAKAVSLINIIRRTITEEIILIGSPKEKEFVDQVYAMLDSRDNITNIAGSTSLPGLVDILGSSALMLTTDSGPAHISNALGTDTIVLFGAGNEHNTAPYNKTKRTIIRLDKLNCEPCVRNECKLYGIPECLLQLDDMLIAEKTASLLKNNL